MKDTDHFPTGIPFTSAVNGSLRNPCGCDKRDVLFWARAKHRTGLERPHVLGVQPPKTLSGSLQPSLEGRTHRQRCFARAGMQTKKGNAMPLISKVPEIVKREFKLEDYVAQAVENYARMIDSTPDHVVNSALKMTVFKDKEFSRWRKEQKASAGRVNATQAPQGGTKA
jgi:hypothetical protein